MAALAIIALLAIFFVIKYNSFVKKEEAVGKQFSNLQSEYQRRLELLPNLVSVVKGSADFEQQTLVKLTEARSKAASVNVSGPVTAENFNLTEAAQADVVNSANRVIATIEKYPDLRSGQAFIRLQDQLEGTERRVKFTRRDFNEAVNAYNNSVRTFPGNIAAKIFGFKTKDGFKADAGAATAPEINFDTKK